MHKGKGITPVIAIILLLLITISMVGVSFVFMQRATSTAAQSGEEQLGQQLAQIGTVFSIEGADKNKVYIKNLGSSALNASLLGFYVNGVKVESDNTIIAPNTIGTVALNDSKLAMQPDTDELKVMSAGFADKITADFYGKYAVGYWKLDEGSGTTASDSSGNGNIGMLLPAGSTPQWVDGKYGKALHFSGVDDYVLINAANSINSLTEYTFEAWIKYNAYTYFPSIYHRSTRYMVIQNDDTVNAVILYNPQIAQSVTTNKIPKDVWTHIVMTFSESGDKKVHVYINGNEASYSIQTAASGSVAAESSNNIYLGNNPDLAEDFNGVIDEVRIMKTARSMSTD